MKRLFKLTFLATLLLAFSLNSFAQEKWHQGVIPYEIGPTVSAPNVANIIIAISQLNATTNITLLPRTNEADYVKFNSILFVPSWSGVGKLGGEQAILLTTFNIALIKLHIARTAGVVNGNVNLINGANPKYVYDMGWDEEENPRLMGDMNGDGRDDIVAFGDGGVFISYGLANGRFTPAEFKLKAFHYNGAWRASKHPRMLGDVNGDGKDDIVGFGNSAVYVAYGTATGLTNRQTALQNYYSYNNNWRVEKHPRLLGDMNGDGRTDIVGFGNSGVYVSYGKANGGFTSRSLKVTAFHYNGNWRVEKHPRMLGDVNGDGRDDVVGFGNSAVYVSYGTANGLSSRQTAIQDYGYNQHWRVESHPRLLGDMNGDGRTDIVGFGNAGAYISYSTGNGFTPRALKYPDFGYNDDWRVDKHVRMIGDTNNDGIDDIVACYDDGTYVTRGTPNNLLTIANRVFAQYGYDQAWRTEKHPRMLADINGDGKQDLIGFGSSRLYMSTNFNSYFTQKRMHDISANNTVEESINDYQVKNYPNPFSTQTTIEYTLPKAERVTIMVYDVTGQVKQVLVNDEQKENGTHQITFDAQDFATGMYYYTLKTDSYSQTNKMIVNK